MNTQQERDSQSFFQVAVFTEVTDVLPTQSRGLLCATEKSFMMKLTKDVRYLIRASLGDRNSV